MNQSKREFIENWKKIREQHRKERKARIDEETKRYQELKLKKNNDKIELKNQIKEIKNQIKTEKINYSQKIKEAKIEIKDKNELKYRLQEIHDNRNDKIIELKDIVYDKKFDFGKKYNTLSWRLLKWVYGLRKEFNRITWSNPYNTFKFLLIILVIVLFLSGIFLGLAKLVEIIK